MSFTSEAVKARSTYECGKRQPFPTQGLEETAVTHLGLPVPAVPVTQRTRWTVQYTLLSIQKIQYVCYIYRIWVWQKLQHIPSSARSSCTTKLISWCANDPDHPKRPAFCQSGMNMLQLIWIIQKRQSAAKSVMTVFLQMIQIIQSGQPFAKKTGWYKDVANYLDNLVCCKVDSP